jgi:hypothetical protein
MLKANVLLSFGKQEEKVTLLGYTDSPDAVDGEGEGDGEGDVGVLGMGVLLIDMLLPVEAGVDGERGGKRFGVDVT